MDDNIVKAVLDKREAYLRRHLVLSDTVINKLKENGIITDVTRRLMTNQSSFVQLDTLMDILRRSNVVTFKKFLRLLKDTHNNWIAEAMLDTPLGGTLFRDKIRYVHFEDSDPHNDGLSTDVVHYIPRQRSAAAERLTMYRDQINPSLYGQTVPRQIYGLHMMFDEHRSNTEKALSMLRQEELAIRDLLSQNAREQHYVRQNQRSLHEIDYRLQELHHKSRELEMRPSPKAINARERLLKLHNLT